eukprot:scaffold44023_cov21-Tisochrysis_lutea.AAC.1
MLGTHGSPPLHVPRYAPGCTWLPEWTWFEEAACLMTFLMGVPSSPWLSLQRGDPTGEMEGKSSGGISSSLGQGAGEGILRWKRGPSCSMLAPS